MTSTQRQSFHIPPDRVEDQPCPACDAHAVGWAIRPAAGDTGVTCAACGYSAPLHEYLLDEGADEASLWAAAIGWDGTTS